MTVTYSFFVHTATTSTPAELMKASNPVPPGVKKLYGINILKNCLNKCWHTAMSAGIISASARLKVSMPSSNYTDIMMNIFLYLFSPVELLPLVLAGLAQLVLI